MVFVKCILKKRIVKKDMGNLMCKLKTHTTLGYIVSLILLNLGHVFCFCIVSCMCQLEEEGSPH